MTISKVTGGPLNKTPEWGIQLAWWVSGIFATGATWYFLSLHMFKSFFASIIVAALGAIIAIYLHRRCDSTVLIEPDEGDSDRSSQDFIQRYLDEPSDFRFITTLPKMRAVMCKACHEGWDTGITSEARKASYELIDFLETSWIRLAEFYPPNHFGGTDPKSFISKFLKDRFAFHWAKHEPNGAGNRGTMIGVMVGGDVISDMEGMISEIVIALAHEMNDFDTKAWLKEWRRHFN